MTAATIGGATVSRARVQLPAWGLWWADVDLTEDVELTGPQTLEIGGASLSCTVVSGGPFDGASSYRLVGGAGGWRQEIPKQGYSNDFGVKLATVIGDAANAAGETVDPIEYVGQKTGPHYARPKGRASKVLGALLGSDGWHVDLSGVTHQGTWPGSEYDGTDYALTRNDRAQNLYEVTTDNLAPWVPGVQVEDGRPATDVEWVLEGEDLLARVFASDVIRSRRLQAHAQLQEALDPRRDFRGSYEYRVVSQDGERLNLQPVRVASGMPDLARVPVRPGMAGLRAEVLDGELVVVTFLDVDPSRPIAYAHDAPDSPGWQPRTLKLDAATLIELGGDGARAPAIAELIESAVSSAIAGHTHGGVTVGTGATGNGKLATPIPSTAAQKVKVL